MFSEEERKIFIEHSMQDENNLKISINAALSFDHLREKIIQRFIESVEDSLLKELNKLSDEWEMNNSIKDNIFDHWRGIFVYKRTWDKQYQVGFSSEKYGAKGFIIGVIKNNEKVPNIDGLFEKLNNEYRQGSQSNSWNWYQWLEHPYQNWDNEEVLIKMYHSEATGFFTKHVLSIIHIATNIIDSHMNQRCG